MVWTVLTRFVPSHESEKLSSLEVTLKLPVLNNNLQRCSINLDGSKSPNKEERKFRTKLTTQLMGQLSSFKHASPIGGFRVRTDLKNRFIASRNSCNGTHGVMSQKR